MVLVVALVVVAMSSLVTTARLATHAIASSRAQVAADAAALAAVQAGAEAGSRAAGENGAHIVSMAEVDGDVVVQVGLHGTSATARAGR
jgi:Tfp pilus assembly protein PilX